MKANRALKERATAIKLSVGALALWAGVAALAAAPVITNLTMVGGVFFDDVAVINNSQPVMADDFNTGKLTGWGAPRPGVIVTSMVTDSTNYCLYMNRENNVKTYAKHPVQCNEVGALELRAKVFLPPPTEQWGYSHGKRERTGIGLTPGRDEHRFNVEISISPGELAYHVELVHIKPEIKEPRGRSETFSSRRLVIAPGKWALVSFKLDPSAGTATVYIDGQPHVSCRYDPSKITTLTDFYITTFMGNLEPAGKNDAGPGPSKKIPSRMGNLEPSVKAAGEATALADGSAGPGQLHFKELLSRLSAASEDCIRGLSTIQCDYRLMMSDESEEPPTDKKPPPIKLGVSGKLTMHLPEYLADWEEPPGSFDALRFEPDAWPMLTNGVDEAEAKELKPFSMPGSKLVCSEAGSWLVSKDDKTAVRYKMTAGENPLFGVSVPTACCQYEAFVVKLFRADVGDAISTKAEPDSLEGRKCAKYLFTLPAGKGKGKGADGAPDGTYAVWLDDATGLPLKEEIRDQTGTAGGTARITYSDFRRFGKGSFSPAKSEGRPDLGEDVHDELQYAPFGTQWFLTKEISVRRGEAVLCTMTFANWRQVSAPDSAFKLPPGAKVISWEGTADEGGKSKK